ncbi:hypothetical protein MOC16_gp208 [Klebsiella phage vB_KpM_FBKp24]|uniref:Uncharacterized protein n=1 Tax=Klebsiella phage vB_KpM_FBKp24 TaxID=2801834 RepID=A0A7U0GBP0_9CAUD|nr:hypothetical protein [Klebsiella pneumoniae]YP_010298842.1 hypothetical protein MOC16_gp208 [Klebsiella phage vB_KpM_FBKp24]QQV92251.1 hypothetical protein vBKpMFBKp24_205 [Klebsiella phage vB_KpM_FBKp24]
MEFKFKEAELTERWLKHCQKELGEGEKVAASFHFQRESVYSGKNPFDGLILATGPELSFHAFLDRGQTKIYLGKLELTEVGLTPPRIGLERLRQTDDQLALLQLVSDFGPLAEGIREYFLTQEKRA